MKIVLLIHILIALAGLAMSLVTAMLPSPTRLRLTAGLVGLTLLSGTYLVISQHAGLTAACLSGVAYLAVCLSGLIIGRLRLAAAQT